jgi:hypothetical protein
MPAFVKVEARRAGGRALGILVPPGSPTLVVARPRSLPWDLLPARWDGESGHAPTFCAFGRDEAAGVARRFQKALDDAVARAINPVQTLGDGEHFQVWVRTEEFVWIVCARTPGQPYRPAVFATLEDAAREAESLSPVFWPAKESGQEFYFNTQNFTA